MYIIATPPKNNQKKSWIILPKHIEKYQPVFSNNIRFIKFARDISAYEQIIAYFTGRHYQGLDFSTPAAILSPNHRQKQPYSNTNKVENPPTTICQRSFNAEHYCEDNTAIKRTPIVSVFAIEIYTLKFCW